ncbi:hypothetical protein MMAD_36170 [Mycolicibacterium madagascariense]|uniref:DUF732 domain-containing protein n=1 Tax=Mycolicibacterium madagascariense TaxID=212765 RepID=A0A7I7XJD3_9MYCO|nr:hypothetical protein MMAD_36170 [Mycolicibacterium madagascariense]
MRLAGVLLSAITLLGLFGTGQAGAEPNVDGKAVVCGTFDRYGLNLKSARWVFDYLTDRVGETPMGAQDIIQISINVYCPQYSNAYDDLNNQFDQQQHPGNPLFN